ncbi:MULTISPECIES: HAD family hydrolase [Pseudofrankia]|uniref:HAD family hydrolase n=1 Tax=Pseudofrankia TaxID=2994363 RepID=UPI0006865BC0|nr:MULTISPECIES: haloacid dehalogenase-like hydrolase [Pseudofrankia]OHV41324.1 haloacid dehalogenase [Pseudofrankia sp. EUN1h]
MPVRLVLWDIDQTLIDTRGMGRLVYERVFSRITGVALRELAALQHGNTELDTVHSTLTSHGLVPSEELVYDMLAALAEGFGAARAELAERGRVLPGALEALTALTGLSTVRQSVLTGNTRAVAEIKVRAFGLDPYVDLRLGAYGDDHRDRPALVAFARDRAATHFGRSLDPPEILLVGDTPNDVTAALTTGAQIVAVASGAFSVQELRDAGAPTVLATLAELLPLAPTLFGAGDEVAAADEVPAG